MIDFLLAVLQALWAILQEASVYLLVGFLLAGVLAVLVPRQLLTRLVGTGKLRSVLWGSVLGAPLPLCSCGVLPTAVGLRKEGRRRERRSPSSSRHRRPGPTASAAA
jgi:uncharacterized protein